jgi:cytochrome c-type biogenesis protein CcmH
MKTYFFLVWSICVLALLPLPSPADLPSPDPQLEQRATRLFQSIRCQVCQGESITDSRADLAKDMRSLIREQIGKGKTDDEIKDFLVQRYGQHILMETPFSRNTALLWLAPLIMIVLGLYSIGKVNNKRSL